MRVALAREDGEIVARADAPTSDFSSPESMVEWVAQNLHRMQHAASLRSVAIGAPGPVDPKAGVLINPPNLRGWRQNVPLGDMLSRALKASVHVENDANVAGLGEHRQGAGKGSRNMVYVTWSTGIGAGLVLEGGLYSGSHGSAGEFGHMIIQPDGLLCGCGQRGCLETVAAGWGIAAQTGRTAEDVFHSAAEGEREARLVVTRAARYVGLGLINLTNLFDPDTIVIGGGIVRSWNLVRATLSETLRASPFVKPARRPKIVRARLADRTGLVGAVEWARAHI